MEDYSAWYKPYCDTIEALREPTENFWYSYKQIDSYGALFNNIIGARGDGKTYGFKVKAIKHFLKTGRQSLYLRRTEGEYADAKSKFLSDIEGKFYPYRFRVRADEMQCCEYDEDNEAYVGEWETVLHFAYLANSIKKKSVSYDKVDFIAYDEYLIEQKGQIRYLDNEVEIFLHFYETVARLRDVKCYFLANAVTAINPYFFFFNITLPNTKSGIKRIKEDIVIQLAQDEEYKKKKKETRFGKLVSGTDYEKHAINNEFILDTKDFLGKKTRDSYYWLTVVVDKNAYGVYVKNRGEEVYISEDVNMQYPKKMEFESRGRIIKNRLSAGERRQLAMLYNSLRINRLWFESLKARADVGSILIRWN